MSKVSNRILLVDDDPDIGIMIKIMLEYHGYSVVAIERGEKAESLIRTDQFELLIMDMLLSGMNGTEICARLKQDPSLSHIPVIMISAHPNAKEICLDAGAEDFISKPFDMKDLLSRVSRFVQPVNKAQN